MTLLRRMARLSIVTGVAACAGQTAAKTFTAPWVIIFRDPGFQIALDTSRVERVDTQSYLLWMQTRWVVPRRGSTRRAPSPFNRELIHAFLRCDTVGYKVARTIVSLDDGPPVDSVGAGVDAARRADWRPASPRSADLGAGSAACTMLDPKSPRESRARTMELP